MKRNQTAAYRRKRQQDIYGYIIIATCITLFGIVLYMAALADCNVHHICYF